MKILVLTNFYPPDVRGGYELSCQRMVEGLRERGHDVVVLAGATVGTETGTAENQVQRHVRMSDFLRQSENQPTAYRQLAHEAKVTSYFNVYQLLAALRAERPDRVYLFNLLGLGVMGIIDALNGLGIPWVWQLGDAVPKLACDGVRAAVRSLFACGHQQNFAGGGIILVSEAVQREITRADIALGDNLQIIPNWGQAAPHWQPPRRRDPARPMRFLATSAISRAKGTHLIIEAAGILDRRGIRNFSVDCFGPGDIRSFFERCKALGLEDRIRFGGVLAQDALIALYRDYDMFLFPSWHREPFGMVPLEAAAEGCPAILSYGCGVAERLVHNVHCFKIRRRAVDLANAMQIALEDEDRRWAMAKRVQALARTSLSRDRLLDRTEAFLGRSAPAVDWQRLDWDGAHRLAYIKDRLAWHFLAEGY